MKDFPPEKRAENAKRRRWAWVPQLERARSRARGHISDAQLRARCMRAKPHLRARCNAQVRRARENLKRTACAQYPRTVVITREC
eukprot:1607806-Pleurochrysis_carterae.AAC.7